jgi:microcompartment protein CcmK/EutM
VLCPAGGQIETIKAQSPNVWNETELAMLLGKVVGTLVATRKETSMEGLKFLVLKQLDIEGKETGGYRVAADAVGAGLGEVVLYATGSAARQTKYTHERPCDGVIMAIVDLLEVDGAVKYDKSEVG